MTGNSYTASDVLATHKVTVQYGLQIITEI